jgi:N-acetylmuramoyl-L-alanine amidase
MGFFQWFRKGKAVDIRELRGDLSLEPDAPAPVPGEAIKGTDEVPDEQAGAKEPDPEVGEASPEPADADKEGKGFFDLEPGQMGRWKAKGVRLPDRVHVDLWPVVKVAALVVVAGLIIVGLVFLFLPSSTLAPDLRGKPLDQAMNKARSMGYMPMVTQWLYSAGHSDGIVLEQQPRPGTQMKKGQLLSLKVSKGPPVDEDPGPAEIPPVATGTSSPQPSTPLTGKIICLDPGHQGRAMSQPEEWLDPGLTARQPQEPPAQGVSTGDYEQSITLDIAGKLKTLLEKDGVGIVMTRTSDKVDIPNIDRAEIANNANAQLLVSIHTGNMPLDPGRNGCQVLYPEKNQWTSGTYEQSKTAALLIQPEIIKTTSLNDLGIGNSRMLTLFNWSKVPVIEAITGYLTNADNDRSLSSDDFRWKVAQGLRNGILKYLNNQ